MPAAVDATERDVTDFLAELREGAPGHRPLAASSAARTLVAVRGLHRFLALEGLAVRDPAADVSPPTPPARLPKAIPVEDVERLLAAASVGDTPVSLPRRALLELLYGVGARIGEAVALDVDDVAGLDGGGRRGERHRTLRLLGKGGKERLVPVGRYAREALAAYLVRGLVPSWPRAGGGPRRCSSGCAGGGSRGRPPGPCSRRSPTGPGSRRTSLRTRCGTPSPPTCSTAARTSGSSRSCSGTPR